MEIKCQRTNCHFRNSVDDYLVRYKEANKREEIALLGNHSVRAVHSKEGRFLQYDEVKVRSVEVDDFKGRERGFTSKQTMVEKKEE